ncbi:MAG: hypothetical protein AB1428_13340 [Bacteroidota bacterium]
MKLSYSWEEVERWRDRVHRRNPSRAVTTKRQALAFVNDVGFCFAFKAENSELPCLWHAACGARDPVMPEHTHQDPAISFVWEMKNVLPAEGKIYYGKLLKRRPMMVSLEFLPYFYVLSRRTGLKAEYEKEFLRGRLSATARDIMDALADSSPQTTKGLKLATGNHGRSSRLHFDRAIAELQEKMFLVKVAELDDPFTFVWAPLREAFRTEILKARRISPETARERILARYFRNQLVASVPAIARLFRWERQAIFHTLGRLVRSGVVTSGIHVEGKDHRYYCLTERGA